MSIASSLGVRRGGEAAGDDVFVQRTHFDGFLCIVHLTRSSNGIFSTRFSTSLSRIDAYEMLSCLRPGKASKCSGGFQ